MSLRAAKTVYNMSGATLHLLRRGYASRAYIHKLGTKPLTYANLGEHFQRAAEKYAKRTALVSVHEQKRLSYEEAHHEGQMLAVSLRKLGLESGAHLGLWAPNTRQWFITSLAAAYGGYTLVCLNPALKEAELTYALNKAKVQALITMDVYGKQNFAAIVQSILKARNGRDKQESLPSLRCIVMDGERPSEEDIVDFQALMSKPSEAAELAQLKRELALVTPDSACNVQFTSGTTGQPKAALLTHFGWVNIGHEFGRVLHLDEGPKNICFTVPLFHAFGLIVLMGGIEYGSTFVLPSATFNAQRALEAVEKETCHIIAGTPTMYVDMLQQQERLKVDTSSLETGIVAGAACSPEVYKRVMSSFGLKRMRNGYGQSESTSAMFATDGSEPEEVEMHSVGKMFPHSEAKVVNERGETVAFGEPGELCVRGYFTMLGFYDDEARTREVLGPDGWLKTGDKFVLESNGLGRIVGRKKDLIIRGGENIYPKEVEDFLETHPDIVEVQVVGVPDERMGDEVCAYLRLRPGSAALSVDDIRQFSKNKIAHFKVPRYVRIVDEFPKTASGKIQKFKLVELFKAEQASAANSN